MTEIERVKCQNCGRETPRGESFTREGQTLCEDCYIEARVQICDPLAVRAATRFRKASGLEAAQGLTELQRTIFEFIKSRGKTTVKELLGTFNLSQQELENQIAVLRHCELITGGKEGSEVYFTPS